MNEGMKISDKVNLGATLLTVAMIPWLVWSINTKSDNFRMAMQLDNDSKYETKAEHKADIDATNAHLSSIDNHLGNLENALTVRLQRHGAEELGK